MPVDGQVSDDYFVLIFSARSDDYQARISAVVEMVNKLVTAVSCYERYLVLRRGLGLACPLCRTCKTFIDEKTGFPKSGVFFDTEQHIPMKTRFWLKSMQGMSGW